LIIIGYGCKDVGINEMITENYEYKHKPSFIVDAFAKEGSQVDSFKEKSMQNCIESKSTI
jgi:hypothetical protein